MLALLGTHQELALAELSLVLDIHGLEQGISPISKDLVSFSAGALDPKALITSLGGTVKLLQVLEGDDVVAAIVSEISQNDGKLHYCVSSLDKQDVHEVAVAVKKSLKLRALSSRFRTPDSARSSAGIGEQWHDYILYTEEGTEKVAKTIAVQDIDRWAWKDRSRPSSDPRSGMLPPKVARMMINIGMGPHLQSPQDMVLFDPFCGSGTILLEGLDMGFSVIGSDISSKAVADSQQNCAWLMIQEPDFMREWRVFQSDVMDLSLEKLGKPVDLIVFEGYLGPPKLNASDILNMHKGLRKMYTGTLKRLRPLLAKRGRIVCALPRYELHGSVKSFDDLIDSCEKWSYTSPVGPFVYGRDTAQIKRNIYVFEAN